MWNFSLLNYNLKMRLILNKGKPNLFIYLFKDDNQNFEKDNLFEREGKTQEKVFYDLFIFVEMFILMVGLGSEGLPFPINNIFQYHFSNALSFLIADGRQNKENYQKDSSEFTGRF